MTLHLGPTKGNPEEDPYRETVHSEEVDPGTPQGILSTRRLVIDIRKERDPGLPQAEVDKSPEGVPLGVDTNIQNLHSKVLGAGEHEEEDLLWLHPGLLQEVGMLSQHRLKDQGCLL